MTLNVRRTIALGGEWKGVEIREAFDWTLSREEVEALRLERFKTEWSADSMSAK